MGQRYPSPITAAMLALANPNAGKPRYDNVADWDQGVGGNDVDAAHLTTAIVDASGGAATTPYPIRTQVIKAAAMVPPLTVLGDLGKDYGEFSGQEGREGWLEPFQPYGTPAPEEI